MTSNATSTNQTPIVCDPNALTADDRERWMEIGKQLYSSVEEIKELPDGYAFRLPCNSAMLMLIAEDLNMERLCCPFLLFTLEISPNKGPFWLKMTGAEGAKEFLRMAFEASNLIDEDVAQAAGFNIAARKDLESIDAVIEVTTMVNQQFANISSDA